MGTINNQNPWSPYEGYKDCSQGICSIYCPQWCYFFPPPPPLDLEDDDRSGTAFSPLIIAIISILASAFLLVSYYTIITKYCRRRGGQRSGTTETAAEFETNRDGCQASMVGLDETLIKSITVCKYIKGDGLIETTECAICLNEFQENENLRLLPKCTHTFHIPCIDTWLKTHSICPLCRSSASPTTPTHQGRVPNAHTSSLQVQRQENDLVLVVEDRDEVIVGAFVDTPLKRSLSLDTISTQRFVLENEEPLMKRSVSTGRFIAINGKGKNFI